VPTDASGRTNILGAAAACRWGEGHGVLPLHACGLWNKPNRHPLSDERYSGHGRNRRRISVVELSLLQKLPLFSNLPDADLRRIALLLRVHHFPKHAVLFSEGDAGLGVWVGLRGTIKLVKSDSLGGEQLLKVVAPEQFFAEVVLFDGGGYPATAIAQTDCTTAVLYNADARALLSERPELAWHFLHVLSQRLRTAQERIRILCGSDATVRLAEILLHVAKEQGRDQLVLGRQDLANMVGVARETVSRVLSVFAAEGYIVTGRNTIALVNKQGLASLIDNQ